MKEVSWLGQGFYVYGCLDLSYSAFSLLRGYRANALLLRQMAFKTIGICTLRLILMHEAKNFLTAKHMLINAKPILNRRLNNQRKDALLAKMNSF